MHQPFSTTGREGHTDVSPSARRIVVFLVLVAVVFLGALLIPKFVHLSRPIPDVVGVEWYMGKAQQWSYHVSCLRVMQAVLAVLAIVSSVLGASRWKPTRFPDGLIPFVAAVSIALLTGLDLSGQANKLRGAWRHLAGAILEYKISGSTSLESVHKAYTEAEESIGEYNPQIGA